MLYRVFLHQFIVLILILMFNAIRVRSFTSSVTLIPLHPYLHLHNTPCKLLRLFSTSSQLPPQQKTTKKQLTRRIYLIRHGTSSFNKSNTFTGWHDAPLTFPGGYTQSSDAGRLLNAHLGRSDSSKNATPTPFKSVYTSVLSRSLVTFHVLLSELTHHTPHLNNLVHPNGDLHEEVKAQIANCGVTRKSFEFYNKNSDNGLNVHPRPYLNERHYGSLQGLNKADLALLPDMAEQVRLWRRSYTAVPPAITAEHDMWRGIAEDARYGGWEGIVQDGCWVGPVGESLEMCKGRVLEGWNGEIMVDVGLDADELAVTSKSSTLKPILIVAHANSLRCLIMHLDNINEKDIEDVRVDSGRVFYYDLDIRNGSVVAAAADGDKFDAVEGKFRGKYLDQD